MQEKIVKITIRIGKVIEGIEIEDKISSKLNIICEICSEKYILQCSSLKSSNIHRPIKCRPTEKYDMYYDKVIVDKKSNGHRKKLFFQSSCCVNCKNVRKIFGSSNKKNLY